jgi:site-specific DNA-methyltransferase (adenine-specific)
MKEMPDNSVDSIVTDPPYELGFMGKSWDSTGIAFNVEVWQQALRVLKPGGHLIAFSGSRTYHRMAVAIEDAGFEIRDQIMWVYGSGFPKSHNISKGLDKQEGIWRGRAGEVKTANKAMSGSNYERTPIEPPVTDAAKQWQGWGTALKPAHEPIVLARKPLQGTVANNVLTFGTGGLNIDASRVETEGENFDKLQGRPIQKLATRLSDETDEEYRSRVLESPEQQLALAKLKELGRWPANFIHDGSDEVNDLLGEPARFFYCAKTSKRDRNEGLDGFEVKQTLGGGGLTEVGNAYGSIKAAGQNHHPTVKPTDLMRYLCRLITPPNGIVLDPFMGSGSTGKAAILEGFDFIGIEQSAEYLEIAQARIEYAQKQGKDYLL